MKVISHFFVLPLLFLGFLFSGPVWSEEKIRAPHVDVSIVSSHKSFAAGTYSFGFLFQLEEEWHVYWKNPGDSGAVPKFHLIGKELSSTPIDVEWPAPQRIPVGPFVNFGYEKDVLFPFTLDLTDQSVFSDQLHLTFKLEWLVCKEECVPGFATLQLRRPYGGQVKKDIRKFQLIEDARKLTPNSEVVNSESGSIAETTFHFETGLRLAGAEWVDVFPYSGESFATSAPEVQIVKDEIKVSIARQSGQDVQLPEKFLIVQGKGDETQSFDLLVTKAEIQAQTAMTSVFDEPLWLIILFSFLGGLILNLMPCVFPVLSIKIFSLLKERGHPREFVVDSFFYFAGVVCSFLALGALFLSLRTMGEQIGWGFQLQSPVFIYLMIILFFILGLNFLGAYEFGDSIMNWAGQRNHQKSSSFFNGVLSVLVATPCTGPFMGTALGAASALSASASMSIFLFLGIGMGAPFLILSFFPSLLNRLPRPGAWMNTMKEFFAFPLFATVIWLAWVLVRQLGAGALVPMGISILGISFFIWIQKKSAKATVRVITTIFIFVSAIFPISYLRSDVASTHSSEQKSEWESFSQARLEELLSSGEAVFIDYTADWCVTCQWKIGRAHV